MSCRRRFRRLCDGAAAHRDRAWRHGANPRRSAREGRGRPSAWPWIRAGKATGARERAWRRASKAGGRRPRPAAPRTARTMLEHSGLGQRAGPAAAAARQRRRRGRGGGRGGRRAAGSVGASAPPSPPPVSAGPDYHLGRWPGSRATAPQLPPTPPLGAARSCLSRRSAPPLRLIICTTTTRPCPPDHMFYKG